MFVVAKIPPKDGAILAHTLRGSGWGGAGLLSEDPAPCAYVLGKWLRREREQPSIRLPAYPSNTTRCRPPPRGVKGLRSHSHASKRAIYARSCKWTSENFYSTTFVHTPPPPPKRQNASCTKEPEPLSKDSGLLPAPLDVCCG